MMTPRNFCYWLQGFLELRADVADPITPAQVAIIQSHLNFVLIPITQQSPTVSTLPNGLLDAYGNIRPTGPQC